MYVLSVRPSRLALGKLVSKRLQADVNQVADIADRMAADSANFLI